MNNQHITFLELDMARTGEASDAVLEHLQSCSQCQEKLERLRKVATDLKGLPKTTLPDNPKNEAKMLAFIETRAREIRSLRRPRRALRLYRWIAATAAVVVLGIGVRLFCFAPQPSPAGRVQSEPPAIVEYAANDLDEDGVTDAVDAYLLATRIGADPAEAEALMRRIVSLDEEIK